MSDVFSSRLTQKHRGTQKQLSCKPILLTIFEYRY